MKLWRKNSQKESRKSTRRKVVYFLIAAALLVVVVVILIIVRQYNINKSSDAQLAYSQAAESWRSRDIPDLKKAIELMESSGLCVNNINCTFPKLLHAVDSNDKVNAPLLLSTFQRQKKDRQKLSQAYRGIEQSLGDISTTVKNIEELQNDNLVPVSGTLMEPNEAGRAQ